MTHPQIAPYGSWKSPITTDLITSQSARLGLVALEGESTCWIEMRPWEAGRSLILRRTADGLMTEVTPHPFNVRTRVHEYGGGDYAVGDGTLYFSNFTDQRLYRVIPGAEPVAITPEGQMRYADSVIDKSRRRLICVCEDHTHPGSDVENRLVSVPLDGSKEPHTLVAGNDFYSTPRLSPDGLHMAWLTWNHPNMPWDGCELWVGDFASDGSMIHARLVAGGPGESIFQPQWSPDGLLYFVSDRTSWWNIYRWRGGQTEALCQRDAEFGLPQWTFGLSTYDFISPQRIACSYIENGMGHLAFLDTESGELTPIETPYTFIGGIHATPARIVFSGASSTEAQALVQFDLTTHQFEVLRQSSEVIVDPAYLSVPQLLEFPTEQGLKAYAIYYPPHNPDYQAPEGERPPVLVNSHGGPTSAASGAFNAAFQFWTSRGFAVLDINYGGSTGYGRTYRERLKGQWGVVDVDDCVNGTKYLLERGLADPERLVIRGGSAGGYTTLCAIAFRALFTAGASYFGVSDAEALALETHKFESHYLFGLIGPYPEQRDLYVQRSAIHFTDRFSCPIIFFQGLDDKVVLPDQAEQMFEALKEKGISVAYVAYEGEGHGFRKAENIKRSLENEFFFYHKIFKFAVPEEGEAVKIENLFL